MADCGTVIVFKILDVLAQARTTGHPVMVNEIADALSLSQEPVEQYMAVLQRAGAVRAEAGASLHAGYTLTPYGLGRIGAGRANLAA